MITFLHYKLKSDFLIDLTANKILQDQIVFIKDSKEIYTHGTYYPNSSISWDNITNKPDFKTVSTTGSYNDLIDKPFIPSKTSELTNDSLYTEQQIDTFLNLKVDKIEGK